MASLQIYRRNFLISSIVPGTRGYHFAEGFYNIRVSECNVWTLTTTCHLLDFSLTLYTLAHLEFENRSVPIKPDGAGSIPDRFAVNKFVRCRLCQQPLCEQSLQQKQWECSRSIVNNAWFCRSCYIKHTQVNWGENLSFYFISYVGTRMTIRYHFCVQFWALFLTSSANMGRKFCINSQLWVLIKGKTDLADTVVREVFCCSSTVSAVVLEILQLQQHVW